MLKRKGETSYKETAFGIIPRSKLIPLEIEGIKRAWDFILKKGDVDDIEWAIQTYGKEFMQDIFQKNIAKLDIKSNNLWCFCFNLNASQCIQKPSIKEQSPFWQR